MKVCFFTHTLDTRTGAGEFASNLINEAAENVLAGHSANLMYSKKDYHGLSSKVRSVLEKIYKILEEEPLSRGEVKNRFEEVVKTRSGGDYEHNRWFKTPILEAGFEMTRDYVKKLAIPFAQDYKNYLELGPGPGTWTKLFIEERPEAKYALVDISEEMLGLAKEKLRNAANTEFYRSDFMEFNPPEKFDFFFSSRAIEYFPNKEELIQKISLIMESGGRGVVITKMPHYRRALGRKFSSLHKGQIPPDELRKILIKYNFEVGDARSITVNFPGFKSVRLNKILARFCTGKKLNSIRSFFSESYGITFKKP